jgi:hypothetical protein
MPCARLAQATQRDEVTRLPFRQGVLRPFAEERQLAGGTLCTLKTSQLLARVPPRLVRARAAGSKVAPRDVQKSLAARAHHRPGEAVLHLLRKRLPDVLVLLRHGTVLEPHLLLGTATTTWATV